MPNVALLPSMDSEHAVKEINHALSASGPGHVVLRQAKQDGITATQVLRFVDAIMKNIGWAENSHKYAFGNVAGRKAAGDTSSSVGSSRQHVYITAHSEAAYLESVPSAVLFSCPQPAEGGGATPLHATEIVAETVQLLLPSLLKRIQKHGVTYIRNFPNNGTGKSELFQKCGGEVYSSWQDLLPGLDHAQAEAKLIADKRQVQWQADGTMRVSWHSSGFAKHPSTGAAVWFNQLFAMNGRYWEAHGGFGEVPFTERPIHATLGNGEEITDREYWVLDAAHTAARVSNRWQIGDVVVLDNFRFMHSREPFYGNRSCVVAMGPDVKVQPVYL